AYIPQPTAQSSDVDGGVNLQVFFNDADGIQYYLGLGVNELYQGSISAEGQHAYDSSGEVLVSRGAPAENFRGVFRLLHASLQQIHHNLLAANLQLVDHEVYHLQCP
ncbi:unnamed protein product, partial [Amoebophrya sp. A25]